MKQNRKLLLFVLVILSASIVSTGLFFGFRRTKQEVQEPLWQKIGNDIDGGARGDGFGYSVSLSLDGNTVAVGTPRNDGNGDTSGNVRIFQWIEANSTWTQMGADIDGEVSGDKSGTSVSLSSDGNTVAIGAPDNDGNGDDSGHVRIFQWTESTSTWTQMGADIDGESRNDKSGTSVSLSSDGNTVAIGAPYNSGNGDDSGHVRIFQWTESNSAWTQVGTDIDGESKNDDSGTSVSLSSDGKTVASICMQCNRPYVRIFQWTESTLTWTREEVGTDIDSMVSWYPQVPSAESMSLSSDGKTVAIGAPTSDGNGDNSGSVRIFRRND
jgi:hypothetical protein